MKYKKEHFFTCLLIIVMVIFTVATSPRIKRVDNRLKFENRDDYYLIIIETINPPDTYILNSFDIIFDEKDEWQYVYKFEYEDNFKIILYDKGTKIIEENIIDEILIETLIIDEYFIIKLNKEIDKYFKYENWKISGVYFFPHGEEYF